MSATELTKHYLERVERFDGTQNAIVTVTAEQALAQAAVADVRLARGDAVPLTGIPIVHKDIFCTAGVKTSCGSRMLDNFVAPYDATIVERLATAGAVVLGKTNMDEFAMGSSNETSFYGPVRNPWNHTLVPGGSSGGSAAAVAALLAAGATGTDTGGSIRQPAALSGITGIKPFAIGTLDRTSLRQLPARAGNGKTAIIEKTPDLQHHLHILATVNTMAGFSFLGSQRGELRFPIPQHKTFDARKFTHLAYLEKKLVWNP